MQDSEVQNDSKFKPLGNPRRIWTVSAIHGETEQLINLHDALFDMIEPGDRVVYHGNYIGYGPTPCATLDEILTFRRMALAKPGMMADDFVYLRGQQEEMWSKLMQLQFAPDPMNVLLWMLGNGMSNTMQSYDICPHDGIQATKESVVSLTRWTNKIREAVRKRPGHEMFNTQLRRAAFTPQESESPLLFVNAGIDTERTLADQNENFWWCEKNFNHIDTPYNPFQRVIRGFDPAHNGIRINCVTATIDGGCGFGGSLVAAGFTPEGEVFEMLEA